MKKRITAFLLALAMVLSLAGCKKDESKKETRGKKTRRTSISETEEPETEETEPSDTDPDDPKPDSFEFTEQNFPYIFCSDLSISSMPF